MEHFFDFIEHNIYFIMTAFILSFVNTLLYYMYHSSYTINNSTDSIFTKHNLNKYSILLFFCLIVSFMLLQYVNIHYFTKTKLKYVVSNVPF